MNTEAKNSLKSFVVEVGVYALLVTVYFLLVLGFLGGWLHRLYESERKVYAFVALGLIIGQGLLLEVLTRLLLDFIKPRTED